jgi:DNA primase
MASPEGRTDAFKHLLPVLQQVSDHVERAAIAGELAEYLKLDRELIMSTVGRTSPKQMQRRVEDVSAAVPPNEKLLLGCLLTSEEAREAITKYLSRIDMLPVLEMRNIFEGILALYQEGQPFSLEILSARVDARAQKIISELSFADLGIPQDGALQQALHCLEALERKAEREAADKLKRRIRELDRQGDLEEAMRLTDELNRLEHAP